MKRYTLQLELADECAVRYAAVVNIEQQFGIAVDLVVDQAEVRGDTAGRGVDLRGAPAVGGNSIQDAGGIHRQPGEWSAVVDVQRSSQRGAVIDQPELSGDVLLKGRLRFRGADAREIQGEAALHGADASALVSRAAGAVHVVVGVNFDQLGSGVGSRGKGVGRK